MNSASRYYRPDVQSVEAIHPLASCMSRQSAGLRLNLTTSLGMVNVHMMIRGLFTLWFAVATILGPAFCCCAFASHRDQPIAAKPEGPAQPEPKKSCCQHESEASAEPIAPVKPERPSCPCKNNSRQKCDSWKEDKNSEESASWNLASMRPIWVTPFGRLGSAVRIACDYRLVKSTQMPFLSAQELLDAHHVLRC